MVRLGNGDGVLIAAETNLQVPVFGETNRLGFGAWRYSTKSQTFDGRYENNSGVYGLWHWRHNHVDGWLRLGRANPDVNQLEWYGGAGLVWTSPVTSRPDDQLGVAIAWVKNANGYRHSAGVVADNSELNIELTWRMPVTDKITVQPDVQYIINPGTNPNVSDALVVGLRVEVNLFSR